MKNLNDCSALPVTYHPTSSTTSSVCIRKLYLFSLSFRRFYVWSGELSTLILIFIYGYRNICLNLATHLIGDRRINLTVTYILKNPRYAIVLSPHLGLLNHLACYHQLWKLWWTPVFNCQMLLKDSWEIRSQFYFLCPRTKKPKTFSSVSCFCSSICYKSLNLSSYSFCWNLLVMWWHSRSLMYDAKVLYF